MIRVDDETGVVDFKSHVSSGNGKYANDPRYQDLKEKGVIPRGDCKSFDPYFHSIKLQDTFDLESANGNLTPRGSFQIHSGKNLGSRPIGWCMRGHRHPVAAREACLLVSAGHRQGACAVAIVVVGVLSYGQLLWPHVPPHYSPLIVLLGQHSAYQS